MQTLENHVSDQAVHTESFDEASAVDRIYDEAAANLDTLKEVVCQLRKKVSELVLSNNRYHLSISNCTVCTSYDDFSDASSHDDTSIKASTPFT